MRSQWGLEGDRRNQFQRVMVHKQDRYGNSYGQPKERGPGIRDRYGNDADYAGGRYACVLYISDKRVKISCALDGADEYHSTSLVPIYVLSCFHYCFVYYFVFSHCCVRHAWTPCAGLTCNLKCCWWCCC